MGTRHLIAVQLGGKYKVAQYGQWDGYPSGQGATVLEFLQQVNLEEFKERVGKLKWVRKGMIEAAYKKLGIHGDWMTMEESARFREAHPEWHRDTGAGILSLIMERDKLYLQNAIEFAGDGLFCEWCYVIDLDENTFEVYSGFKKGPLPTNGRFEKYDDPTSEYWPVSLLKVYWLHNLPTREQFLKDLEPQEEQDSVEGSVMKACSIPDPTKDQLKIMVEMLRASTVEEEEEE
jgi:hypothetical protein